MDENVNFQEDLKKRTDGNKGEGRKAMDGWMNKWKEEEERERERERMENLGIEHNST